LAEHHPLPLTFTLSTPNMLNPQTLSVEEVPWLVPDDGIDDSYDTSVELSFFDCSPAARPIPREQYQACDTLAARTGRSPAEHVPIRPLDLKRRQYSTGADQRFRESVVLFGPDWLLTCSQLRPRSSLPRTARSPTMSSREHDIRGPLPEHLLPLGRRRSSRAPPTPTSKIHNFRIRRTPWHPTIALKHVRAIMCHPCNPSSSHSPTEFPRWVRRAVCPCDRPQRRHPPTSAQRINTLVSIATSKISSTSASVPPLSVVRPTVIRACRWSIMLTTIGWKSMCR
jgi:hypothetical protein